MASEEKRYIHGVPVVFPCKPYPSQFSMMEKVIKGIERRQNCLLESPTGSGKSLALLCSALAWQTAEYEKKAKEDLAGQNNEETCTCTCKQNVAKDTSSNTSQDITPLPPEPSKAQSSLMDFDDDSDFQDPSKKSSVSGTAASGTDKPTSKSLRKHQSIEYEISPSTDGKDNNNGTAGCCTCNAGEGEKKPTRKVPKIYFGTRTHKQVTQICRELRKTAYREVSMTILGSREHTCIHPVVSKMKNKNEGCKELMDGHGCSYNDRVKKVLPNQEALRDRGLKEAWDLEDLIEVCREHKACPYFGSRGLKKDADIVFCPYNYLIDSGIRDSMDIILKDQIIILDEAHNMEDCSREAASETISSEQLENAVSNLDAMIKHQIKVPEHLRIRQVCSGLLNTIMDNEDSLHQSDFDQAYKCWSGYEIVARLEHIGAGPNHYGELMPAYFKIKDTDDDPLIRDHMGNIVKLHNSVLITIEVIYKMLRYLYMEDLKFIHDFRVAIVKSTTYVRDTDTNNKTLNSRKKRGGMQTQQVQSISFWCMNPAVAFSDLGVCRNVVLTSGTLSPMSSFESELGVPFPIKLEASHVIEDKQVWVGAMAQGPQGGSLHCVYKNMETLTFQDEMGETVLKICQKVPHGVLCFMPSYKALEKFRDRWQRTGLWYKIEKKKKIICEPRASERIDFDLLMRRFYQQIEESADDDDMMGEVSGALFIAVCRGKVSEGLDFTDNNARAVILVGIPYPNFKDIQVKLKREYNDKYRMSRGLLSGSDWYEIQAFRALNQALGRCIRHRKDWGALILADERFVKNGAKYCKGLSKWVRNKVQQFGGFYTALDSLSSFTQDRIKDMPKVNLDSTFIPGTPITPGKFCIPSPISSTPVNKDALPPKFSKEDSFYATPIKPISTKMETSPAAGDQSSVMLTPVASPTMFLSPSSVSGTKEKYTSSLLSPTALQNNQKKLIPTHNQTSQIQQRRKSEPTLIDSSYNHLLNVINSSHTPKDKPYYVIMNEGTPIQQTYLIQPPAIQQEGVATKSGNIAHTDICQKTEVASSVPVKSATVDQNVNMTSVSADQETGVAKNVSNLTLTVNQNGEVANISVNQNVGVTKKVESSAKPVNQTGNVEKKSSNVSGMTDINKKSCLDNSSNIGVNRLYKFCNIPQTATSEQKDQTECGNVTDSKNTRSKSPNLFDNDTHVMSVNQSNDAAMTNIKQENLSAEDSKQDIKPENSFQRTTKKPIFKKGMSAKRDTQSKEDENHDVDDFRLKTRSVIGGEQCKLKDSEAERKEEMQKDVDEPLRTRRSRGVKRKSLSNTKGRKKSKGVDFLDEIETSRENKSSSLSSISCKNCGKILVPNLKEFEMRKRIPVFLNKLTSRNTEVLFIKDSVTSKLTALQTTAQGVNLNCVWDETLQCCLQYVQCVFCSKTQSSPILGVKVIHTLSNDNTYQAGQMWLISSAVNVDEKT